MMRGGAGAMKAHKRKESKRSEVNEGLESDGEHTAGIGIAIRIRRST